MTIPIAAQPMSLMADAQRADLTTAAWTRSPAFWVFVLATLALAIHDVGRSRHCPCCARPFAVWPVRGRLHRWVALCWRCAEVHRHRSPR